MKHLPTTPLLPLILALCPLPCLLADAHAAGIRTYTDQAVFVAESGATNASGPLPNLGLVTSAVVGSVTFGIAPGGDDLAIGTLGTILEPDEWCPLLPGNDIAQGYENLQIDTDGPVYALGIDFVQPDATLEPWGGTPVDSTFEVSLYDGATLVGQVQFASIPADVVTFLGVWSDTPFTSVTLIDITESPFVDDDEFFGEVYTGTTPLPPAAVLTACTDKAQFLLDTGAVSASGPLPNLGSVTSVKLGSLTFGIAPGGDDLSIGAFATSAAPDWYPLLPGHDIAQGYENLQVDLDAPVFAFGFDFAQPDATMPSFGGTPVDSTFEVRLYADDVLVGAVQFSSIPVDVVTFLGVCSDTAFNRATIIDITESPFVDDDEFYGEFYTGPGPLAWNNLGYGLAGTYGDPLLCGTGPLTDGSEGTLVLVNAAVSQPAALFLSLSGTPAPFKCGTLLPVPVLTTFTLATSPTGEIPLGWLAWPAGLSGFSLHFQYALLDAHAPCGVALSNALRADVP